MDYCPLRCTLDKVLLRLTATPLPRSFPEAFCLSLLLPEENTHSAFLSFTSAAQHPRYANSLSSVISVTGLGLWLC